MLKVSLYTYLSFPLDIYLSVLAFYQDHIFIHSRPYIQVLHTRTTSNKMVKITSAFIGAAAVAAVSAQSYVLLFYPDLDRN